MNNKHKGPVSNKTELIRITYACNERCVFCNIPFEAYPQPLHRNVEDIFKEVGTLLKSKGKKGVSLSGGEPTTHPEFFAIVKRIKKLNISPIEIQTNAVKLADAEFTLKMKKAGVDKIFVSFHSHKKEIHDELTGLKGSWEKSVEGIKNASKIGISVILNPVLTTRQVHFFPEYVKFVAQEFPEVKILSVSVVQPHGRVRHQPEILPDYAQASQYIAKGVELAKNLGIQAHNPYCGLPQCFGNWFTQLKDTSEYWEGVRSLRGGAKDFSAKDKMHLPQCSECVLNSYCKGVWKSYLDFKNPQVNPIKISEIPDAKMRRQLSKEIKTEHVDELRHWTRLNFACNNRCIFCLDKESLTGEILSVEAIKRDLAKGLKRGAKRVVLSGGEATIHPKFVEIVALAKSMGYRHIQVITNGRMFSYKKLLEEAVLSGLNEVTFSLHGHTALIHDSLTGIPGSFSQAYAGLKNALSIPGLIVSVDVVLTKKNIAYLYDILTFFIKHGVFEFDLLHIVPYGRAWDNWSQLWYNPEKEFNVIKKVLKLSKDPRLHIWTNRFPINHLEGYEHLIQSPNKLLDEVNGRQAMFSELLKNGTMPECIGKRCDFCFIRNLCYDIQELRAAKILKSKPAAKCLHANNTRVLKIEDVMKNDVVDFNSIVEFFIGHRYTTKSLKCKTCVNVQKCEGALVTEVKEKGFKILKQKK